MLNLSLGHSRFSALPQVQVCAELLFVSCRHFPGSPTQTSGGVSKVLRTAAAVFPSGVNAKSGKLPKAWRPSAPFQIVRMAFPPSVTSEKAVPPPTYSLNRIRSAAGQKKEVTEPLRPLVRLTTSPPAAVIVKRSPP